MACGVGGVRFSVSAGADVPEPFCSVLGWGNPVEEDMVPVPGYQESRSLWPGERGAVIKHWVGDTGTGLSGELVFVL